MKMKDAAHLRAVILEELLAAYDHACATGELTVVSFAFNPKNGDLIVGDEENDFHVTREYTYIVSEVTDRWERAEMVNTAAYVADELMEIYE